MKDYLLDDRRSISLKHSPLLTELNGPLEDGHDALRFLLQPTDTSEVPFNEWHHPSKRTPPQPKNHRFTSLLGISNVRRKGIPIWRLGVFRNSLLTSIATHPISHMSDRTHHRHTSAAGLEGLQSPHRPYTPIVEHVGIDTQLLLDALFHAPDEALPRAVLLDHLE